MLGTIGDAITGVKPSGPISYPLEIAASGTPGGSVSTGTGGSGIAGIAQQYIGHAYFFGGAPGKDGSRPWDCSSFVNWIVSVKAGMAIPGNGPGKYDGTSHGPPTGMWAAWTGMDTVSRANVQSGDILVWSGHMGIATSNSQYISAHSPAEKTTVTSIPKTGLGPLVRIGRLR